MKKSDTGSSGGRLDACKNCLRREKTMSANLITKSATVMELIISTEDDAYRQRPPQDANWRNGFVVDATLHPQTWAHWDAFGGLFLVPFD